MCSVTTGKERLRFRAVPLTSIDLLVQWYTGTLILSTVGNPTEAQLLQCIGHLFSCFAGMCYYYFSRSVRLSYLDTTCLQALNSGWMVPVLRSTAGLASSSWIRSTFCKATMCQCWSLHLVPLLLQSTSMCPLLTMMPTCFTTRDSHNALANALCSGIAVHQVVSTRRGDSMVSSLKMLVPYAISVLSCVVWYWISEHRLLEHHTVACICFEGMLFAYALVCTAACIPVFQCLLLVVAVVDSYCVH
jgi:hypothetical protein